MVDEVPASVEAPATPAVEAAPVETVQAPVEAAPVVEAPVVDTPKVEVAEPLLAPVEEAVEAENPVEAPVEEAKVGDVVLPTYEFKLPEGAKTDTPEFKSFTKELGEFQNLSKAEQSAVQQFGQKMLDMHMNDIKSVLESQNKQNWEWFKSRNNEWLETAKSDQAIGGDNWDRTISDAQTAIALYGGSKAQQVDIAKVLQESGVENHPAVLRFLSNIRKIAAKEGTPVVSQNVPAQKQSIATAMFGNTRGAA